MSKSMRSKVNRRFGDASRVVEFEVAEKALTWTCLNRKEITSTQSWKIATAIEVSITIS